MSPTIGTSSSSNGFGPSTGIRPTNGTPASRAPSRSVIASPTNSASLGAKVVLGEDAERDLALGGRAAVHVAKVAAELARLDDPDELLVRRPRGDEQQDPLAVQALEQLARPGHERAREHLVERDARELVAEALELGVVERPIEDLGVDQAELLEARDAGQAQVEGDDLGDVLGVALVLEQPRERSAS